MYLMFNLGSQGEPSVVWPQKCQKANRFSRQEEVERKKCLCLQLQLVSSVEDGRGVGGGGSKRRTLLLITIKTVIVNLLRSSLMLV